MVARSKTFLQEHGAKVGGEARCGVGLVQMLPPLWAESGVERRGVEWGA